MHQIIEVLITESHKLRAKEIAPKRALKNSHTSGAGNLIGALGEVLVCEYYNAVQRNTFDYDIILDGKKIDVKTKRCASQPQSNYNCTVYEANTNQKCDYYCFVRVNETFTMGWICGFVEKQQFFSKAKFDKAQEPDKEGQNEYKFLGDCYNIKVSDLFEWNQRKINKKLADNFRICDNAMEQSILAHLLEGESKGAMLAKFNNDKIALVKFIRDRAAAIL